jgi:hypothetical protein
MPVPGTPGVPYVPAEGVFDGWAFFDFPLRRGVPGVVDIGGAGVISGAGAMRGVIGGLDGGVGVWAAAVAAAMAAAMRNL